MTLDQVQFPEANDVETRIAWAGERAWDIAEGLVSNDVAALIATIVIGWADLGTEDERAAYRAMASQIDNVIQAVAA